MPLNKETKPNPLQLKNVVRWKNFKEFNFFCWQCKISLVLVDLLKKLYELSFCFFSFFCCCFVVVVVVVVGGGGGGWNRDGGGIYILF